MLRRHFTSFQRPYNVVLTSEKSTFTKNLKKLAYVRIKNSINFFLLDITVLPSWIGETMPLAVVIANNLVVVVLRETALRIASAVKSPNKHSSCRQSDISKVTSVRPTGLYKKRKLFGQHPLSSILMLFLLHSNVVTSFQRLYNVDQTLGPPCTLLSASSILKVTYLC